MFSKLKSFTHLVSDSSLKPTPYLPPFFSFPTSQEENWFSNHRLYGRVEPGYFGTKALVDRLMKVLSLHIRQSLPAIKRDVHKEKQNIDAKLEDLGREWGLELDCIVRRSVSYLFHPSHN